MCLIFGMASLLAPECARPPAPGRNVTPMTRKTPVLGTPSDHSAPHHPDGVAGHVGGGVGGEEHAGVGDVHGTAEAAERDLLELLHGAGRGLAELGIPLRVAPPGVAGTGQTQTRA